MLALPWISADAANSLIVQKTLNPLPSSVLIPASVFRGSVAGVFEDRYDWTRCCVWFGAYGDLTNDGYPEVLITGWGSADANSIAAAPVYLFSTSSTGIGVLDPARVLGTSSLLGTAAPRILDLKNNGLNDFFYLGHNESPGVPIASREYIQRTPGNFVEITLPGPRMTSHNSNVGDFNGDGYPDVVASNYNGDLFGLDPRFNNLDPKLYPDVPTMVLYLNKGDGTFDAHGVRFDRPLNEGYPNPFYTVGGGGSASAICHLATDGKPQIVMSDVSPDGSVPLDTWLMSNMQTAPGEAWGKLTKLPAPYFEYKPEFKAFQTGFPNHWSHDIHVDCVDVDQDGLEDILISSIIWHPSIGTQAGVLQILRNKGNLEFEDVTDKSLYNFFLGKGSGHQTFFMDVNGDGFVDIVMPEVAHFGPQGSDEQTWANQVLINTGKGKFVQAMWNEFHELTLSLPTVIGAGNSASTQDHRYFPYQLPDGRIGFVTRQDAAVPASNQVRSTGYFDFRATRLLSTGPNATNPAELGVPGFSEYFYLTEYPDAASAVQGGKYASGLAHYLAEGRAKRYAIFAPNARIVGSDREDTLTLDAPASRFIISGRDGKYRLTDTGGQYGVLRLEGIEKVQFGDRTLTLADAALSTAATVSGTIGRQTISISVTPAPGSKCSSSQIWIAAALPGGQMYFNTPKGWSTGSGAPAWGSSSTTVTVPILENANMTSLQGTTLYAGYGCDLADLLENRRYAPLHTIGRY